MPTSTSTVDSANTIAADIRLTLMGLSDNARSVASAVSHSSLTTVMGLSHLAGNARRAERIREFKSDPELTAALNLPAKTKRMRPLPEDFTEQITIQLPEVKPLGELYEHPHGPPVQSIKHVSDLVDKPIVTQTSARLDVGGSVKIVGADNQTIEVDAETGYMVILHHHILTFCKTIPVFRFNQLRNLLV